MSMLFLKSAAVKPSPCWKIIFSMKKPSLPTGLVVLLDVKRNVPRVCADSPQNIELEAGLSGALAIVNEPLAITVTVTVGAVLPFGSEFAALTVAFEASRPVTSVVASMSNEK